MEAIKIKKSKSSMNLDRGLDLPSVWNPVFDLTDLSSHTLFVVAHLGPCNACFFTIYLRSLVS